MSELNADVPEELDPVLVRAAVALRQTAAFGSEFEDRVMAAVRLSELPATTERRRAFGISSWPARSATVELSRLRGLAIAAGVAALLATGVWLGRQSVAPSNTVPGSIASATDSQTARAVEFVLVAPGASQVMLVGDFNGWSPAAMPLHGTLRQGIWSITVPLTPGRHEYTFLVDGKHWLPDPRAPRAPTDDFGTPNSVVTVTERS